MQCNIDKKGQIARFIWGILCLTAAATLGALRYNNALTGVWVWPLTGVCVAFGLLGFYEAKHKWCIMRAMGVKTKF